MGKRAARWWCYHTLLVRRGRCRGRDLVCRGGDLVRSGHSAVRDLVRCGRRRVRDLVRRRRPYLARTIDRRSALDPVVEK